MGSLDRLISRLEGKLLPSRCVARIPHTLCGELRVVDTHDADGLPIRVLEVDGSWQSACYRDDGWSELAFPYHRLYNVALEHVPHAPWALMLGGGGYSYPTYLLSHLSEAHMDVVEIDPRVSEVARRHFTLPRLDELCGGPDAGGRLRSYNCDARVFLEGCQGQDSYDLILNDCFSAREPLRSLTTLEAARLLHQRLAPGGCYLANVVSALEGERSRPLRDVTCTLDQVFSQVYVLPCGMDDPLTPDNNVVVASDDPWVPEGAYPLVGEPRGQLLTDAMP